eukprot:TRINITY_DN55059_c0_g1_i1.p1 TRINITY_DN55059_c0_g1~~TRINITY_DN55059_c0_g1_i1.p1  ORF type:complete len:1344 (-),score=176.14 TRINITY_DN55059_c0_g1_i1:35-4066(-)
MTKADVESSDSCEGWLLKKSHHVGLWRNRYVRLESDHLRYWTHVPRSVDEAPRGKIPLKGAHVFATTGTRRFAVRSSDRRFDEELEAKGPQDRENWIRGLNAAAVSHRASQTEVGFDVEALLRAKGLWDFMQDAVVKPSCVHCFDDPSSRNRSPAFPTVVSPPQTDNLAFSQHVRHGRALLRVARDEAPAMRQGAMVQAGRCLLSRFKSPEVNVESSSIHGASTSTSSWATFDVELVLVSTRRLKATHLFEMGEHDARPSCRSSLHLPERGIELDSECPLELEVVYAYDSTQKGTSSLPFICLPLGDEHGISAAERSTDGSGFEITSAYKPSTWSLVFPTLAECESWRAALDTSRRAAISRTSGLCDCGEEALAAFDRDPVRWCDAIAKKLADVDCGDMKDESPNLPASTTATKLTDSTVQKRSEQNTYFVGLSAASALRRTISACHKVFCEAEDVLHGALQIRPLRRDVCKTVADSALAPVGECLRHMWSRWSAVLPQSDSRELLRWIEGRREALFRLGVIFDPLRIYGDILAAELSLRSSTHLRSMVVQLLTESLRMDRLQEQPPQQTAAKQRGIMSRAVSLPVDLFSIVFACLAQGDDCTLSLRMGSQRAIKFVIHEVQVVLWRWLLATHSEVLKMVKAPSSASEYDLPNRAVHWLALVAIFAEGTTSCAEQCHDLNASASQSSSEGTANDPIGASVLPAEWSVATEACRFEALHEAFLWAASDLATAQWRRHALGEAVSSFGGLGSRNSRPVVLAIRLGFLAGKSIRSLREFLEPANFENVFLKIFDICLGSYIIGITRAVVFQENTYECIESKLSLLSDDLVHFCKFFDDLAASAGIALQEPDEAWKLHKVVPFIRAVLVNSARRRPVDASTKRRWSLGGGAQANHGQVAFESGQQALIPSQDDSRLPFPRRKTLHPLLGLLSAGALPLKEVLAVSNAVDLDAACEDLPPQTPLGGFFTNVVSCGPNHPSPRTSTPSQTMRRSASMAPALRTPPMSPYVNGRRPSPPASPKSTGSSSMTPRFRPPGSPFPNFRKSITARASSEGEHGEQRLVALSRRRAGPASRRSTSSGPEVDKSTLSARSTTPSVASSASAAVDRGKTAVKVASEGDVCELRVQDVGAYGLFCGVVFEADSAPEEVGSWATSSVARSCVTGLDTPLGLGQSSFKIPVLADPKRRWVQLSRGDPREPPRFQIFTSAQLPEASVGQEHVRQPSGGAHASSNASLCVSHCFEALLRVDALSFTALRFSFVGDDDSTTLRYTLYFDCPSHLHRWRFVLEGWWAAEIESQVDRPVVAIEPDPIIPECKFGPHPVRLHRDALEARLGGLWREVYLRLEQVVN